MKFNLKNRPRLYGKMYSEYVERMENYLENMEKELREMEKQHNKSYENIKHPIHLRATVTIKEILGE